MLALSELILVLRTRYVILTPLIISISDIVIVVIVESVTTHHHPRFIEFDEGLQGVVLVFLPFKSRTIVINSVRLGKKTGKIEFEKQKKVLGYK